MPNVRVQGPTGGAMLMDQGALAAEFEGFWSEYPRKIGKLAALKAYRHARTLATFSELIAGVERYMQHKPSYADYAHASSWLNAGRWMDSYDTPKPAPVRFVSELDDYHAQRERARAQREQTR